MYIAFDELVVVRTINIETFQFLMPNTKMNQDCPPLPRNHLKSRIEISKTNGVTSLHEIAKRGKRYTLNRLLREQPSYNIDEETCKGWTALMFAASRGHAAIVDTLLEHGADSNKEKDGWTARHFAQFYGHHEVVNVFLKHERRASVEMSHARRKLEF